MITVRTSDGWSLAVSAEVAQVLHLRQGQQVSSEMARRIRQLNAELLFAALKAQQSGGDRD